jgi:transposase
VASVSHLAPIHLGLDVHKDTISVGILEPDRQIPDVDRIAHDEVSVRRLLARFPDRARLRACYEAGPTGFELARLLHRLDVRCEVIAPSLIPRAPGDKARDRPAGLPAAGPVAPRRRAGLCPHPHRRGGGGAGPVPHQRRHGRRPHPGTQPVGEVSAAPRAGVAGRVDPDPRLQAWPRAQRFDQPAMTQTFHHYLAVVEVRNTQLDAVEADLVGWCARPPFDWQVARLAAYRGITRLGALTLAAEVADWRRFAWHPG